MKQRGYVKYWMLVIALCTSNTVFAEPFAKGPYLGQTPPGPAAKVFAPGLISDTRQQQWDAFGTFSADGNTFCFQRCDGIYITENSDNGWTVPKLIKSIREKEPSAWSPCLSPDANSIYFTRGLLEPVSKRNLYRSDRTAHGWSEPQSLGPPLSSADNEITCSIAANNNIYLGSGRKGSDGRSTIWVVPFVDNNWAQAEQISLDHQQANDAGIAPDESFMVFTAKYLPGGYGHRDLYVTVRLPDGTWSTPQNLGPKINSKYIEHGPRISPDKKYLFFNRSNGWDPGIHNSDIYWVELKEHLPDPNDPKVNQTDFGFGSTGSSAEPFAVGPYLGQTPPGSTAQIFAPGLICDTRPHQAEGHVSFSADSNTFCFSRFGYVFITENTDKGWTTPKRIKSVPYMVWSPCLSPDANSIYFSYSYDPSKRYSLHRCIRTSLGWSSPDKLGPPFIVSGVFGGFSVAPNHSIYFTSDADHGGRFQFAPLVGDTWPRGINIPLEQGNLNCCHPGIAPDESFMVFYSIRPGARGGTPTDLYLTLRRPDGTWTEPQNLGPRINSPYYEIGPRISPDKKYMFFIRSNGWGENSSRNTSDIYWVALKEYLPDPNDPNKNQTDFGVGITDSSAKPFAKEPYLGQTPPGPTPQVFAPGLISDTRPHKLELWPTFSSDGNTFCFNRNGYVFITENTDQGWTRPKRIKNIPFATTSCCVSPDANSIYFNYCYNYRENSSKHYSPYRCQRMVQGWSKPQKLGPPLNSSAGELVLCFAANNNLYIGSKRKRKDESSNIWVAPFVGNTWPQASHISFNHPAADPGIAPDESFMVVTAINQSEGYGQRDLYLTLHLPDGTWSKPQNLGPRINSANFEYGPRISHDKKYLFFTRADGWGGYGGPGDTGDIYWVELKEYLPESYR